MLFTSKNCFWGLLLCIFDTIYQSRFNTELEIRTGGPKFSAQSCVVVSGIVSR